MTTKVERLAAAQALFAPPGSRVQRFALQVASRERDARRARGARGASGLAGSAVAATSDKAALTALSLALFNQSTVLKSLPPGVAQPAAGGLRAQVQSALDALATFQPWTDSSSWYSSSTYYDSQTCRSNLQQALENVNIAAGQTSSGDVVSSTWTTQTDAMAPVEVTSETIKNLPDEVKNRVADIVKNIPAPPDWAALAKKYALYVGGGFLLLGGAAVAINGYASGRGRRVANPRTPSTGRR